MSPLNHHEILIIGMIGYLGVLTLFQRVQNRDLYIQQRRYPLFACRDAFARMRLSGEIEESLFDKLIEFTNNILLLTEEIDLRHFIGTVNVTSMEISSKSTFSEDLVALAKKNPEFKKQLDILIQRLRWIILFNSIRRFREILLLVSKNIKEKKEQRQPKVVELRKAYLNIGSIRRRIEVG